MGGGWVRGSHTLNVRLRSSNNTVHAAAEQAWLCSGFVLFHQKAMQNTRTKLDSHLAPGAVELLISDCQQTKAAVCTEQSIGAQGKTTPLFPAGIPLSSSLLQGQNRTEVTGPRLTASTSTACSSLKSKGISSTFPQKLLQEVSFAATPLMFMALTMVSPTHMLFGSPQL